MDGFSKTPKSQALLQIESIETALYFDTQLFQLNFAKNIIDYTASQTY
jgi:hypothetical protein